MSRRLLVTLCILLASASGARAEDEGEEVPGPPFPTGTSSSAHLPFYAPAGKPDADTARAWAVAMARAGQANRGTRVGADMLIAAAHAQYHVVKDLEQAFPLFRAAVEAYPGGDPTRALALYALARREVWRGNFPAAGAALEDLETWERARWPKRMADADQARWEALSTVLERGLPILRAEVWKGKGRFADAAAEIERLAELTGLTDAERTRHWERAARLYNKAEEREAALRAVDRVIELTPEGGARTHWIVWRVYADHGLLTREGAFGPTALNADDAFYEELLQTARARSGYGGMAAIYLAMGSSAFVGRRRSIAMEIYLLALKDPTFVDDARREPGLARGALIAVGLAIDMGRLDEAEHLLAIIERIGDLPDIAGHRESIKRAREALEGARRDTSPPPEVVGQGAGESTPRLERLRRLETGDDVPEDGPGDAQAATNDALPDWVWFAGGALVALGLLLILRKR